MTLSTTIDNVTEQTSTQRGIGDDLRSLRRSRDERMIAGVMGGLAQRLGVDPVLLRIVTVVLALFGGVGIVIYALGWLLIPEDGAPRSLAEQALGRGEDSAEPATLWLAGGLTLAVLVTAGTTFSSGVGPLLLVAAAAGLIVLMRKGDDVPPRPSMAGADGDSDGPASAGLTTDDVQDGEPGAVWQPDAESGAVGEQPDAESGAGESGAAGHAGDESQDPADHVTLDTPVGHASAWPEPPDWPGASVADFEYPFTEPPAKPKRHSSHLGALTLSAVAIGLGVLAIVDAAGSAAIPSGGYVALALAIIGIGLLIGTWLGRPRGLIGWGMGAMFIALPITVLGDFLEWDLTGEDRTITIGNVAELPDGPVSHNMGRARYDLSELEFADTDNFELEISQKVGALQIVVPPEVDVTVNASTGMGHIVAFDEQGSGHQDITTTDVGPDGEGGGTLTLDLSLDFGEITVERDGDATPTREQGQER